MSSKETASKYKDDINSKIYNRNIPNTFLEPYISFTPMQTKYNKIDNFQIKRNNDIFLNKIENRADYNQHLFFNPGSKAPWKGFANNVNDESILRNQIYSKQKCNQSFYVPSSSSDLYIYSMPTKNVNQSHPLLFKEEKFNTFNPNPNPSHIGQKLFFNDTRNQIKWL